MRVRQWFKFRLSTWIVAMLTVSALVGINLRPYEFYFPRPPWVADLKDFVIDRNTPDPFVQCGVYGWPAPAFPSWNWCGNQVAEGEFPQWGHFGSGMTDAHIACNWPQWNRRALVVDAIANVLAFILVMSFWFAVRKLIALIKTNALLRRSLRFELSTWIVAVLTVSMLLGLNMRPMQFQNHPDWVERFASDSDRNPNWSHAVIGWPRMAYPQYGGSHNMQWEQIPDDGIHLMNSWSGFGDVALCRWDVENLSFDALISFGILIGVITLWRVTLTMVRKFSLVRNTSARSYIR